MTKRIIGHGWGRDYKPDPEELAQLEHDLAIRLEHQLWLEGSYEDLEPLRQEERDTMHFHDILAALVMAIFFLAVGGFAWGIFAYHAAYIATSAY